MSVGVWEGVRVWRVWEALVKDVCIIQSVFESIEWVEVFYSEM